MRWKKETVRNSWAEQEDKRHVQEQGKGKTEARCENRRSQVRCNPVQWLCVVHGEEVYEKVQRYFRHLLRKRAQDEKREDGRAVQHRNPSKDGALQLTAARITDENAGSEDRRHTAGGVFAAVCEQLLTKEQGAVTSIPGNEGIIAHARVNVRGGMLTVACSCLALRRMDAEK